MTAKAKMKLVGNLLYKEITLGAHPSVYLTVFLGAMLFIPAYPYIVVALFSYIGIQVSFQMSIGYQDEKFTALLPISKKNAVLSKFLLCWYIQGVYTISLIIFALIADFAVGAGNALALDANLSFFGEVLIFYGVFNACFLPLLFKSGHKIGLGLIVGLLAAGLVGGLMEIVIQIVPTLKTALDGLSAATVQWRVIMLIVGIIVNVGLNVAAYFVSVKNYEKVNI